MNKIIISSTILLLTCIAILFYSFINQEKTAFVNTIELYQSFHVTKERAKMLEQMQNQEKQKLDSMSIDIKSLRESGSNNAQQLGAMEAYFRQVQQQSQQKITSQSQAYEEEIWKQLNQYVIDYGNKYHYDYIFGATGNGSLMYSSEKQNITKKVLEYINGSYDGN